MKDKEKKELIKAIKKKNNVGFNFWKASNSIVKDHHHHADCIHSYEEITMINPFVQNSTEVCLKHLKECDFYSHNMFRPESKFAMVAPKL